MQYNLALLRSVSWLDAAGAVPGLFLHLQLDGMGLDSPAEVVSIDPCPAIEADDGTGRMVVTGTMCHPTPNILDVDITGHDEPLSRL